MTTNPAPNLKDLVDLSYWQKIQDYFSEVIGLTLRTLDLDGVLIVKTSGPARICNMLAETSYKHHDLCRRSIFGTKINDRIIIERQTNFKCPFGLDTFIVPIKALGDKTVAYMITGPVILNKRKKEAEYTKEAKEFNLDTEKLLDALIEINVFSYSRMRVTLKLLSDIFSHIVQTGYHKKRLGEITPEVRGIDPLFSKYYEEKVFNAVLNACMIGLDADSGSVMKLDQRTNQLRIKVAQKLDKDIVDNTSLKLGEGIAGLAASTAEPIILPKDRHKDGLANKMKRSDIRASLIIPFTKGDSDEVYGVVNLNVIRKEKEFSDKDILFVRELISLAGIALIPVK